MVDLYRIIIERVGTFGGDVRILSDSKDEIRIQVTGNTC